MGSPASRGRAATRLGRGRCSASHSSSCGVSTAALSALLHRCHGVRKPLTDICGVVYRMDSGLVQQTQECYDILVKELTARFNECIVQEMKAHGNATLTNTAPLVAMHGCCSSST